MRFDEWEKYYLGLNPLMIPNEYVVRAFMGDYPFLCMPKSFAGKNVCDISCGDGRNLIFFNKIGLQLFGTEVTDLIVKKTKANLSAEIGSTSADIRIGVNANLPFDSNLFDYCLSWNAIYYLESEDPQEIKRHVAEAARVIKPGGYLICSVPLPQCYSLQGSQKINDSVIVLSPSQRPNWGGGVLTGQFFFVFQNKLHVEDIFGNEFIDFRFCTLTSDCFGLSLSYLIFVCRKK